MKTCNICPRNCNVNRINSFGYCNSKNEIKISKTLIHMWEEPCISGKNGSGTIFFSGCNLKCVYCQNYKISQENFGKEISINRLSEIFLELQNKNVHNINLVTPSHYSNKIKEAINIAKDKLLIPLIYNTNSYEKISSIKELEGYINVYLPDLKYFNNKYGEKYSNVKDYFRVASKSIEEMVNQVGPCKFDENGMIISGVIIRHLVLPGLLFDSKKILDYINYTFSDDVYISLMSQYSPYHKANEYPEINKPLNKKHYESLIDYALSIGIKNGFIQDEGAQSKEYTPNFDLEGV